MGTFGAAGLKVYQNGRFWYTFKPSVPDFVSIADLFRRIGLDERIHKEESFKQNPKCEILITLRRSKAGENNS